ncbi:MAG: DUF4573 domain-containing protein, partial [Deltaproteobacteria bacterium]|nr:DUF4573 domain-containing protein [Deltaproteobacteria bacterium]
MRRLPPCTSPPGLAGCSRCKPRHQPRRVAPWWGRQRRDSHHIICSGRGCRPFHRRHRCQPCRPNHRCQPCRPNHRCQPCRPRHQCQPCRPRHRCQPCRPNHRCQPCRPRRQCQPCRPRRQCQPCRPRRQCRPCHHLRRRTRTQQFECIRLVRPRHFVRRNRRRTPRNHLLSGYRLHSRRPRKT